jgi:ketosteroid isomerase-like protein
MKKTLLIIAVSALASCVRPTDIYTAAPSLNIDSLTREFLTGWNAKDSLVIAESIANNAVVISDAYVHSGFADITKGWKSAGVTIIGNLKASSLISGSDNKIAYDAGTLSFGLQGSDDNVLQEAGNYNLVWTRQYNGEWKLTYINFQHVQDLTRLQAAN